MEKVHIIIDNEIFQLIARVQILSRSLARPAEPEVDPVERLHNVSFRVLQVFFRWSLQNANMRKLSALLTFIKSWSMIYRDDVGRSMEQEVIWKINTVRKSLFLEEYLLTQYRSV